MKYECKFDLNSIIDSRKDRCYKGKFWLEAQGIPYEEEYTAGRKYITALLDKKQFKELCKVLEIEKPTVYI